MHRIVESLHCVSFVALYVVQSSVGVESHTGGALSPLFAATTIIQQLSYQTPHDLKKAPLEISDPFKTVFCLGISIKARGGSLPPQSFTSSPLNL